MSSRHGGGYVPYHGGPYSSYSPPRHGGGYIPGQQGNFTPTTVPPRGTPVARNVTEHPHNINVPNIQQNTQPVHASPRGRDSIQSYQPPGTGHLSDTESSDVEAQKETVQIHIQDVFSDSPSSHIQPVVWSMRKGRYRMPEWNYNVSERRRHRDALGRIFEKIPDDRFLRPGDARPKKLIVQTVPHLYNRAGNTTYRRTHIRNISPRSLRIAFWATQRHGTPGDPWMIFGRCIVAGIPLSVLLMFTGGSGFNNGGMYEAFPYKYYGYAKSPRNACERPAQTNPAINATEKLQPVAERVLRPRYLCFLEDEERIVVRDVESWTTANPGQTLDYIFVAYTGEQFSQDSRDDMEALHSIARRATTDANLRAYWVGCSCMPDQNEMEQDVYRISDVIRGAHSLVIAVGPNDTARTNDQMLRQWGSRMWTYPEVLLTPGSHIKVYNCSDLGVHLIQKNQFAASIWTDAPVSRQLIDHYEGSLLLSRLELVTLALTCLHTRNTSEYLKGDHSYALMGLLRLRPNVDRTDTAFQAFARLSLANDSDRLLERLICTLPKSPNQHWSVMDDAWDAKLWDIYPDPNCQVAGVGHGDTVIMDGLRGASVRWNRFQRPANLTRSTFKRLLIAIYLQMSPLFLFTGLGLLALSPAPGAVLIIIALVISMSSPGALKRLYGGKFWYTQPLLFGFEGHLDIETIERHIWGICLGRLEWSPYSSPLSRHQQNRFGECDGIDPITDPAVAKLVDAAQHARPGSLRIFTIVDTGSMRATLIQAKRPPVAFLVAGEEGGMQRAIGVSYEWETATCYRETVIRMDTPLVEKMARVGRLRFGLNREMLSVRPAV